MITRHISTRTYERDGQPMRDEVTTWRLFGLLPLFTQRCEIEHEAAPISDELRTIPAPPPVTATIAGSEAKIIFSREEQIAFSRLIDQIIERYGDDSAVPLGDIGMAIESGTIATAKELITVLQALLDDTGEDEPLLEREV